MKKRTILIPEPGDANYGPDDYGPDDYGPDGSSAFLTYSDALHLFNLATVTEDRSMDEQIALLDLAGQLDLVPLGDCFKQAMETWKYTGDDGESVTDKCRRSASAAWVERFSRTTVAP